MAIPKADSSAARQAPSTEPKQAPKNETNKPQDNSAAKQTPRETKSAVNNAFGKVPGNDAKAPAAAPADNKTASPDARTAPARGEGKTSTPLTVKTPLGNSDAPKTRNLATDNPAAPDTAGDANAMPPVDPRVQGILDTKRPDGKTVKEKLDADSPAYMIKAAQDHYNKQKESGEALDSISKFYLNNTARYMAENGVKEDDISPEKLADVFDIGKINANLDELVKAPDFLKWAGEQQANAIEDTIRNNPDIAALVDPLKQEGENHVNALRRMQSDYLSSHAFADAAATAKTSEEGRKLVAEGMKTLAALGLGEKEMLVVANTLSENIRSKYAPDAPKAVIDPNTNKPIQTDDGDSLATLPDGTYIALGKDGKPVTDKNRNAYVYYQDGTYKLDENNAYIQYDARSKSTFASYGGIKYMVGPDRKGMLDAQGRPLVIDNDGGAPVALDKESKAAVDAAGNKLVFDPNTGKALADPQSGNAVVIDPRTKGVVQANADGKIVVAANGNPYAADQKTGKFLTDKEGRYVLLNKEMAVPGVVPGYVIDQNNTKMVVDPYNQGRPMVDPATGKTVIFTPDTNSPELVPLDANGRPLLASDGKNVVYDQGGNPVVRGTGTGPNWLIDANGNYASDGKGNYIGVGQKSGAASPVDAKGVPVQNANGQVPLWDTKAYAPVSTADGNNQIVLDKDGNLLETNKDGQTVVEEKTGLPFLIDPKTRAVAVNPETGRLILLDTSGAAVEYNADDGYKYLVHPAGYKTVKTAEGQPVVIDDQAGMPVAVNPDGSRIKNPDTGNTIVYGIDGKPAVENTTGFKVEVTPDGTARLIDPKTNAPVATKDKDTGGLQLYNPDGSNVVDPKSGNKVQLDPNGHHVEVDPKTGKFATDPKGNTLILGPDNTPLKTPEDQAVVVDKTGAPVAVEADGTLEIDPDSGLPRVINTETGKALEDPVSKASVVVDPKTGAPVQVDKDSGVPIADPATGLTIVASMKTGEQGKGPNGEPIVVLPGLNVPAYFNKQNNTLNIADPQTGKAVTNPKTGAEVIIDPQYGIPIPVLPDKNGGYTVVDDDGNPMDDGLGNKLTLDKATGQVVIKLPDGTVLDALTLEEPKPVDMNGLVKSAAAGATADTTPIEPPDPSAPLKYPWAQQDFVTTPADRAALVKSYREYANTYGNFVENFPTYDRAARRIEWLKSLAGNEGLKDIPTEDLIALRTYTRAGFHRINAQMRAGKPGWLEPFIKGAQSALNQMYNNGYAYEGPATRYLNLKEKKFAALFQEGGYYRNKQFMSASTNPDWQFRGNIKLKFDNVKGVRVDVVSASPQEAEVIIRPNELLKTDSIDDWVNSLGTKGKEVTINSAAAPEAPGTTPKTTPPPDSVPDPDAILPDPLPPAANDIPNDVPASAAKAAGKWNALGKTLKYLGEGFGIATGGLQSVAGGFQIDDGIKNNNPYDIAAGAFNVASGAFSIGSSVAALAGGAAAAAALPFAAASVIAGGIAGIIDFVNSLDDDEQFADELGKLYEQLGILKEGWREKAQEAYKDGSEKYMGPDYQA